MLRSNFKLTLSFVSAVALALSASRPAIAQQDHTITVGANYTYVHTNVLAGCNCFGMNGGGAQFEYGFGPRFSLLADVTVTHHGGITPDQYALTQSTFSGGFRYRPALVLWGVHPFGEVLLGGAHAAGSLSPGSTGYGSSNAFAFQSGGGLEVHLSHRLTFIPVEADYLLTTFSNGAGNHQNDLRLSTGLAFRLRH